MLRHNGYLAPQGPLSPSVQSPKYLKGQGSTDLHEARVYQNMSPATDLRATNCQSPWSSSTEFQEDLTEVKAGPYQQLGPFFWKRFSLGWTSLLRPDRVRSATPRVSVSKLAPFRAKISG